jgi:hypothetical protein
MREGIFKSRIKKMKYAEKINMFMLKRNDVLEKYFGFQGYYTKEDEKDILSWDERKAKKCWEEMIVDSLKDNWACPFCDYYRKYDDNSCLSCSYGGRHGICNGICNGPHKSTWIKLRDDSDIVDDMLVSGVHIKIINEIKKQDKEND